jgi:hypothetical protein
VFGGLRVWPSLVTFHVMEISRENVLSFPNLQKKLRRRVEKRIEEARFERKERRERLLQIKHEQTELTEKDDWEGYAFPSRLRHCVSLVCGLTVSWMLCCLAVGQKLWSANCT